MTREAYIDRKFSAGSLELIAAANKIIAEYQRDGFTLTLRQLYYQFVHRKIIRNKLTEYKRLGSVINDARLAGKISWLAIEDRTRNLQRVAVWDDPADIVADCVSSFRLDPWETQETYIEVWIEKDALTGVLVPVCERWRVAYFACRGYSSQSEQWRAGKRLARKTAAGKRCLILHLGDHDPSGIDMTRDNADRLSMFADERVDVKRLALNYEQVEELNLPPDPAKLTDSRASGYIDRFGAESWELDALDPKTIDGLIDAEIQKHVDQDEWQKAMDTEEDHKALLQQASDHWEAVAEFLGDL